jgi:hypothetical protein
MNIINQAADNYQQQLIAQKQTDPLAQLAAQAGLKVNSPEAEQKLRLMGQAITQQAAQSSQVQTANAVDKATSAWKQSQFQGAV